MVSPPERENHAAAYAENLGLMIIAGGQADRGLCDGDNTCSDSWQYSVTNNEWERININSLVPVLPHRVLRYSSDTGRLLRRDQVYSTT